MQGLICRQISWLAIRAFNHASITTSFAYSNNLLSNLDQYLWLDWEDCIISHFSLYRRSGPNQRPKY